MCEVDGLKEWQSRISVRLLFCIVLRNGIEGFRDQVRSGGGWCACSLICFVTPRTSDADN